MSPHVGERESHEARPFHFGSFDGRFVGITMSLSQMALEELMGNEEVEDTDDFSRVAIQTVIGHETRHFHDFLLSPRGSIDLRQRIVLASNAAAFLTNLRDLTRPGVVMALPIPVGRWVTMEERERAIFLKGVQALTGPLEVPELPVLPAPDPSAALSTGGLETNSGEAVGKIVERATVTYARLENALADAATEVADGITSQHVREGAAYLVQAQDVWRGLGAHALATFEDGVLDLGTAYILAPQVWKSMSGRDDIILMLAALAWACLGSYKSAESTPVNRFLRLCRAAKSTGVPSASPGELIEVFDHMTGVEPTSGVLRRQVEEDRLFLSQLEGQAKDDPFMETFAHLFAQFLTAKQSMTNNLFADAESYFNPLEYLEALGSFPIPHLRFVTLPGQRWNVTTLQGRPDVEIMRADWAKDGTLWGSTVLWKRPYSTFDPDEVAVAYNLCLVSDVLFDQHLRNLDEFALKLVSQRIPDVRLLNVIRT